jgi:hypothetical protein
MNIKQIIVISFKYSFDAVKILATMAKTDVWSEDLLKSFSSCLWIYTGTYSKGPNI